MSTTTYPSGVTELVAHRWSPRAFLDRRVEAEDLHGLFEAARWAASCFNEQPWRFVTATKADPAAFAKVLGLLVEKNQEWAQTAYLLGFSAGKKTFSHSGAPDRYGLYDTGAAMANLAIEATARGIHAHFMGGFDVARARTEFGVPEDFEIGAAFAIGYVGETAQPAPARANRWLNWSSAANGVKQLILSALKRSQNYKAHLSRDGLIDGRIIFDGFATAKNFGDWIVKFPGRLRQGKNLAKLSTG